MLKYVGLSIFMTLGSDMSRSIWMGFCAVAVEHGVGVIFDVLQAAKVTAGIFRTQYFASPTPLKTNMGLNKINVQ